jgi:hypothetical protein
MRIAVTLALALALASSAVAGPRDDLASPDQAVRDAAATTLRTTFTRAPRGKFAALAKSLRAKSMTKPKALAKLKRFRAESEGAAAGGGGETVLYRVDDSWIVEVAFSTRSDARVFAARLIESIRYVWVEPPKEFTGRWTTYFVNGHPSHQIHYRNGKYAGTFTSFHDDGSKAVVQNYVDGKADGEDTGFHRGSGKVAYRGVYKAGEQVGTWTWYDESGKVTSTRQY